MPFFSPFLTIFFLIFTPQRSLWLFCSSFALLWPRKIMPVLISLRALQGSNPTFKWLWIYHNIVLFVTSFHLISNVSVSLRQIMHPLYCVNLPNPGSPLSCLYSTTLSLRNLASRSVQRKGYKSRVTKIKTSLWSTDH